MLTIFLVIAIPLAIVAAGYYWRDRLSGMRVILFNAVSAGAVVMLEIVSSLAGVPWADFLGQKSAGIVILIINLSSIGLRFLSKADKPLV